MNTTKIDVFLSYAREDSLEAARLYSELCKVGLNVWFDQESLKHWQVAIDNAIKNARYFIAMLSKNAVGKQGYVQKEIRRAISVLDEYPDNQIYLILIRLNDCQPSYKRLADLNWTDMFPNWDTGVQKLIRFLVGSPLSSIISVLRFDGLYQSERLSAIGTNYRKYLRFYSDKLVIAISSISIADEVIRQMIPLSGYTISVGENDDPQVSDIFWQLYGDDPKGYYSVNGSTIRFSISSRAGKVDYEGVLAEDTLILKSHSHINGYRDVQEYTFVQINDL